MQLKGIIKFFTIALILICVYQLSFTLIAKQYEGTVKLQVNKWAQNKYLSPQVKYPDNKDLQSLYADTLDNIKKQRYQWVLDSTKNKKVGFLHLTTYQQAKDKELVLGLDLQGGMSVTMEVSMDGLIRSLANYTKDTAFNTALDRAIALKANSRADLITLFAQEYKQIAPQGRLLPFFLVRSNGKLTTDDNNEKVLSYLHGEGDNAFNNTFRILRRRIDKYGLSSPNINPDPQKGIINIELAGVNDPERIRKYLQSTANLQFFEVYTIADIGASLIKGEKALQTSLDEQLTATQRMDSTVLKANEYPIEKLIQFAQQSQDKSGKTYTPANIGYVLAKDTPQIDNYLNTPFVKNFLPDNCVFLYGKMDSKDPRASNVLMLYAIKTLDNGLAPLEGDHVASATQDYDESGRVAIKMTMDRIGTKLWADLTTKNVGKPIAIVLDNTVYSAPNVNTPITEGNSEITGNYTLAEAQDLADILQSGKLPAPAKIVQEQIIGPTLGAKAVHGGLMAFGISFLVIFILMLLYYNSGGWVANIALILNLLFTVGILAALGLTLTAPGIAGLVLTIGMAVDTNVIIFERIKEELSRGKGYLVALNQGYQRSLAPILDAHVTTFLTAMILFIFGLGPILGFATTQMVGIALSLFCGILVSRLVTDLFMNKSGKHREYFTSFSRKIFQHAHFKFIEYRKYTYIISAVVLVLGIASFFNGFDKGVEFSGGRSYTIRFDKPITPDAIRDNLKAIFEGETPIIKTIGTNNQLNITTAYKIHDFASHNVDSLVETKLYQGLLPNLPAGTSFADFDKNYKESSQTVLPSISDDLKAGAVKAAIIAMFIICFYIFIRFRDWRYSIGTIVSLLHDVFVTLIVFSFFRKIVPFPLEIDQNFIAAVLTVIGFSMNDTVIVYDRIREDSKLYPSYSKEQVINTAINQTLSRTVMTSLTVFLTILILFIFGGEVTRGFAFAMLVGVITGTYSSIFVAAPILVDFNRKKPLGQHQVKDEHPKLQ
ncbi:MAG: protein translocase subunit SecDF [Phycisphaerales bacterium]|nr:protein translocase subunit SecDF [Phycisphaerales bacterium]